MTIGVVLIISLTTLLHFGLKSNNDKTHAVFFTQTWLNYVLYEETEAENALMCGLGVVICLPTTF